jgi:acyl transferase domain-containing protein/acyl carrier protein
MSENDGVSQNSGVEIDPALLAALNERPDPSKHVRPDISEAELKQWLREWVSQATKLPLDQVTEDRPMEEFGLSSRDAVALSGDVEDKTNVKLTATVAFMHPTIATLAEYIINGPPEGAAFDDDASAYERGGLSDWLDVAVVGVAARFPGGADAEAFWEMLRDGREGVGEVSLSRWDAEAVYNADPDAPGKSLTRRAGLLDSIDDFDAHFFGVAPREAACMDPQHRLLLETGWRALEHAGVAASELEGARAGVWIGVSTHEYLGLLVDNMTPETIDAYYATGTSPAAGAGRISYRLGLEGPAVTIDTACSSSLVAIHQACQALRLRECDLALAGGVNAILTPALMISMSRARMLAPDGKCKTFDAAADGYVRGEGCGVIVLKRLSDALRDGDRIRAVMRGSAVNQDGASGGLTVPNGRAQQRVIRAALDQAGLVPGDVDYLEAHGTGTSLGDPIEAQAAAAALGAGRPADRPLLIGSAKTNIGHLEAAAGVAGVLKVVLSLEHELLPKHLNFRTPSPHIPWKRLPLKVVAEARPWPRADRKRRAGVSSFGFSGTNAHVILEEAPARSEIARDAASPRAERPWHMLPLSARNAPALKALAQAYSRARRDAALGERIRRRLPFGGRRPLASRASRGDRRRARSRGRASAGGVRRRARLGGSLHRLCGRSPEDRLALHRTGRPIFRDGPRAL